MCTRVRTGETQLIQDVWASKGPYDAVLGFSQGAILISFLLAKSIEKNGPVQPKAAVLMGGFYARSEDLNVELSM